MKLRNLQAEVTVLIIILRRQYRPMVSLDRSEFNMEAGKLYSDLTTKLLYLV